ncbi:MAG TPA: amino acid-binding protein, partial [Paludibacteraceae bacterium]|nr:amino acid-binding protein [Paludibacteraceae bacterium]
MTIQQLSVFLENKSGRLLEVTKVLGENNINMSAFSIADTSDFGMLRMIVDQP